MLLPRNLESTWKSSMNCCSFIRFDMVMEGHTFTVDMVLTARPTNVIQDEMHPFASQDTSFQIKYLKVNIVHAISGDIMTTLAVCCSSSDKP